MFVSAKLSFAGAIPFGDFEINFAKFDRVVGQPAREFDWNALPSRQEDPEDRLEKLISRATIFWVDPSLVVVTFDARAFLLSSVAAMSNILRVIETVEWIALIAGANAWTLHRDVELLEDDAPDAERRTTAVAYSLSESEPIRPGFIRIDNAAISVRAVRQSGPFPVRPAKANDTFGAPDLEIAASVNAYLRVVSP